MGTLGAARLPAKREGALLRTAVRSAHWAPLALRAFPPSGSEPSFGRPCGGLIGLPSRCALRYSLLGPPGGLIGLPSRCALRYSLLGRPGGLMRRGLAHGTGEWRCPRAP